MSKPKIFSSIEGVEFYKVKKYSNSNKEKIKEKIVAFRIGINSIKKTRQVAPGIKPEMNVPIETIKVIFPGCTGIIVLRYPEAAGEHGTKKPSAILCCHIPRITQIIAGYPGNPRLLKPRNKFRASNLIFR